MNRSRVKAGKLLAGLAAALAFLTLSPAAAPAQSVPSPSDLWYAGTRLVFDHPQILANGTLSVGNNDSGLARFLGKLNATLSYEPGQKYIVITTGDRRSIAFALGDTQYTVAGVKQSAALAPYLVNGIVYLPFMDLARALSVDPIQDGDTTVLQPQIASLEERSLNRVTIVTLRGASPLHFRRLSDAGDEKVSLAFSGIASTLAAHRSIPSTILKTVTITVRGSAKNPTTVIDFDATPGSVHALGPSDSPSALVIAFAPPGSPLGGAMLPPQGDALLATTPLSVRDAPNVPPPPPPPAAIAGVTNVTQAQGVQGAIVAPAPEMTPAPVVTALSPLTPATISGLTTAPGDAGLSVNVAVAGSVNYEWHRLPDNRWYVDFKPATLGITPPNLPLGNAGVQSLRIKGFIGPTDRLPTVRLAVTLTSPLAVNVAASDGGLTISIATTADTSGQRVGLGQLQDGKLVASDMPAAAAPSDFPADAKPNPVSTWKFNPPAGPNGRLIVIDPGHGGSDYGAMHNGLVEKDLNLDISKRLRAALITRGWLVKMTRDTDVDVYQANDSAHDELQARCDVANSAGARLFISVHTNSFTSSGLNGTTTYYYKDADYGLAQAVHARLAGTLATRDDGVRKENFYVIRHTVAPAVLVETAFLSNPSDAEFLKSPLFLQKIALGIAEAVGDYTQNPPPVSDTSNSSDGQ